MVRAWMLCAVASIAACKMETSADGPPPPPELGARIIDRMGRAAVHTALNDVLADNATKAVARDAWNRADRRSWGEYTPAIERSLAIYDGLDGACGNQLLARPAAVPGRYSALAGLLADDRIFLNTGTGQCESYLAVE